MTEPRFINPGDQPVHVRDPQGHTRVVRPFRELAVFGWRKPEDCICVGAHYANFPGLLAPFPEPEQAPAPVAQAAREPQAGAELATTAPTGRYRATGDVVRPDGTVKTDSPRPAGQDRVGATAEPSEPVEADDEPGEEAGDGHEGDEQQDRPLEDVPGVNKVLASALRKAGYRTAVALADCQDDAALAKLGKVRGVRDARALAEAAQDLLGWVEEDERA